MAENRKENDDRSKLMDLDGIEGLLQQVDVMVGVGSLSPFPEAEAGAEDVVEEAASSSASGEDSEAVFDELDAFETMASPVQYVKGVEPDTLCPGRDRPASARFAEGFGAKPLVVAGGG